MARNYTSMVSNRGVSSGFDPARLHPKTGEVRPHNGVDIKADAGTPVYLAAVNNVVSRGAIGDGAHFFAKV